jgi:hypothetical protein
MTRRGAACETGSLHAIDKPHGSGMRQAERLSKRVDRLVGVMSQRSQRSWLACHKTVAR